MFQNPDARNPSSFFVDDVNAYPLTEEIRSEALRTFRQEAKRQRPRGLAPEALVDGSGLPLYMDFNTLNRCNVSCTMCPPAIRHDKLGVPRDPYYRLTLEEFKQITSGARISSAHFVGEYAEPLLNKEIFALVAYAHGQGAFTAITTNATALSRDFGQMLIDAGLDMMTISLHGATAKVAEAIMIKSDFSRILSNIRAFQRAKEDRGTQKPDLYFNFVVQRSNAFEMPAFIELAHDLGVRFVNFIHLIDGDDVVDASENLINHPELLAPNIANAMEAAVRHGIALYVSPALMAQPDAPGDQRTEGDVGHELAAKSDSAAANLLVPL